MRNRFSRSDCGSPNTRSGGPSSSIRPFGQKDDVVGHLAGEFHLVGDQQHGAPLAGQIADHGQHLAHQFGVERARGLIEQHRVRLHRERPGDGGALLLAAGQKGGIGVVLVGQPDPVEQAAGRARSPRPAAP